MTCTDDQRRYVLSSIDPYDSIEEVVKSIDMRRFEHFFYWIGPRVVFHDPDVGIYLPEDLRLCIMNMFVDALKAVFCEVGKEGHIVPFFGFYELLFGSQREWFFETWRPYLLKTGFVPFPDPWEKGRLGYYLAKFYGFRVVKKDPGLTYLRGMQRFTWSKKTSLYTVYFPDAGEAYAVYVNPSRTSEFKRFVSSKGGTYTRFDPESYWAIFRSPQWAFVAPVTALSISRDLDYPVFFRYGGYFGKGVYAAWDPFTDPRFAYSLRMDLNFQYFFFRQMRTYFRKFGLRRKLRPLRWLLYEAGGLYEVLAPPDA